MRKRFITAVLFLSVILPFTARAGVSVYTQKFNDARGVFFTEEEFGIKADGKGAVEDVEHLPSATGHLLQRGGRVQADAVKRFSTRSAYFIMGGSSSPNSM